MTAPAARSTRLGLLALVAAALCWGSVVVTIKVAARGLPILTITVIEVVVAVVVLGALLIVRGGSPGRPGWALVGAGLLEPGLAYPLINAGLDRTSGTHGAVIIGLESVLVIAGDALWARLRPSARVALAVAVATTGAALVTSGDGGSATLAGDALVAAGILVAAAYVLLARRRLSGLDAAVATFYQFLFGGGAVLAVAVPTWALSRGAIWGDPSAGQVTAAVVAGLLGSAAAFLVYNWALGRVTTALAGTSLTLIPVFGIAFSAIFLGDSVTVRIVVGAAAVLAGVALADA